MDLSQFLLIVFCFFLIWLVVKFVSKFLFKFFLLIFIALIIIFSFFNFSEENIFDTMQELYCEEKIESRDLKCICFVNNIISDFEARNNNLSNKEIEDLKNNTSKSFYEFLQSYNSKKEEIRNCFEINGQPGGMSEEIKNDVIENAKKTLKLFNKNDI